MDYVDFLNETQRILSTPEVLSEETSKGFSSVVSKMEKAHRQLVNNLHTLTVANSDLKRLRSREEFKEQKDTIAERVVDIEKRVIETLKDAVEDLESQIGYVRALTQAQVEVTEEEEEIV